MSSHSDSGMQSQICESASSKYSNPLVPMWYVWFFHLSKPSAIEQVTSALKVLSFWYSLANRWMVSLLAYMCSPDSCSLIGVVVEILTSMPCSHSLMKFCHACCRSSYSVESEGSGRSSLEGEMNVGILGSLDSGLTLECIHPGLWIMTIPGKAVKTSPHAANLQFVFSYVFAQVNTKWSMTSSILSPSMKGWKCTRLFFCS